MNHRLKTLALLTTVLSATYGAIGCGGEDTVINNVAGGTSGGTSGTTPQTGTGSGNASTDTFQSLQSINTELGSALPKALQAGTGKALVERFDRDQTVGPSTYACTSGGDLSISGDVSTANSGLSFDLNFDFNCTNLDGALHAVGNETVNTQTGGFTFDYSLDGQVGGNGCLLDYQNFSIQLSSTGQAFSFILNGNIHAACGASQVTCSFNQSDLSTVSSTSVCQ